MAKERSPNRDKALQIWLEHKGEISNRDIAAKLGEKEKTISNWKCRDEWNVVLQSNERSTTKKRESKKIGAGAPLGNKNALGNTGGIGGPPRNGKAVTHGFFRRIFPDDEETQLIIEEINVKSPIDILWENIVIQYTAIARAQKIMFVRNQDDMSKEIRKIKTMSTADMDMEETEWEIQFAWDKHATFLQAQSRAISTLESLLGKYEDMLTNELKNEKKHLELAELRAKIAKLKGDEEPTGDDGFIEALKGKAAGVWSDGETEA